MPYSIVKRSGDRPYKIINTKTGQVVGSSVSKKQAQYSVGHRMSAEKGIDVKYYKRKVDNKMNGYGETDLEKRVIKINKSKKKNKQPGEIIDSITHELNHVKHPKMYERNIRKKTESDLKRMNRKQKQKKYNLFRS